MTEIVDVLTVSGFLPALFSILGVLVGTFIRSYTDGRIDQKLGPVVDRLENIEIHIGEIQHGLIAIRKGQETMDDHRRRIERLENRSMTAGGST